MHKTKTLTSSHINSHADYNGVLLSTFVKYAYKIIYGHDKRKQYEKENATLYLIFSIKIPITKCVAYEACLP